VALSRAKKLTLAAALLLILGGGSFFLGNKYSVDSMEITRVTSTQVGFAMKGDHFYSDFRGKVLAITGTVAKVIPSDKTSLVTFISENNLKVSCRLTSESLAFSAARKVTLIAVASKAERTPDGVLLQECVNP
jgi:hypothetical protein